MIPLKDDIRKKSTPFITIMLVAANVIAFAYSLLSDFDQLILKSGFKPIYLFEHRRFETLLTSLFLHAGMAHLAGNMIFLYIFGRSVEDRLGALTYFALYLLSGITGNLLHTTAVLLMPSQLLVKELDTPLVGASGAISGVIGAYVVFYPHSRILTLVPFYYVIMIRIPARLYVLVWFIYQIAIGVLSLRLPVSIAAWAHVGGFFAGSLLALAIQRSRSTTL